MAAQTCIQAQHATLSGSTADSVTFSGVGTELCVTNRDSTNTLYFSVAAGVTAVAAADDTYVVLPLQSKTLAIPCMGNLVISVVANGGGYSAEIK